jgi:radical SAM superfamily enzyme YgiQ (UPF0313 family)
LNWAPLYRWPSAGSQSRAVTMETETIRLFIPPAYETDFPPLGTPALLAFLRSRGVAAFQSDLNISFDDYLKRRKLERIRTPEWREEKIGKKVYYHKILQHRGAFSSFSYGFENVPGSSFAFAERLLSSKLLVRYIRDAEENPYVNFFRSEILPTLKDRDSALIGFSITAPSQVVAALTFGYFIKKLFPRKKIVVGGQWVSLFREALQRRPRFHLFFDYLIFFEGETPLFRLIDALRNRRSLAEVPNLMYRQGGRWTYSRRRSDEAMDGLPPPDFDGLPLEKYAGEGTGTALTLETSRGCYWSKCTFCVDLPLPRPRYRERSPDLVLGDIRQLIDKYGVRHLRISSATVSPWQMRELSRRIIREKIDISFWAWGRLDEGFDHETLALAKKAGCATLGFGLESFNQRVLHFIRKGTKTDTIRRIREDAADVGLPIYFQAMIGLPSETREEAWDTIGFLATGPGGEPRAPSFNIYYLTPKNRVFLNPMKYGIRLISGRKLPFRFFHPFEHVRGNVGFRTAQRLISAYSNLLTHKRSGSPLEPSGEER